VTDRIVWEQGANVDPVTGQHFPDHLYANLDPHVSIGMRVDDLGDYVVSFVVGIKGTERSLPEIEDFIRRCSRLLDDEPVIDY